jgi:hypothetical protein
MHFAEEDIAKFLLARADTTEMFSSVPSIDQSAATAKFHAERDEFRNLLSRQQTFIGDGLDLTCR